MVSRAPVWAAAVPATSWWRVTIESRLRTPTKMIGGFDHAGGHESERAGLTLPPGDPVEDHRGADAGEAGDDLDERTPQHRRVAAAPEDEAVVVQDAS